MQCSRTYMFGGSPTQFCRIFLLRSHSPMGWQHGIWLSEILTISTKALQSWSDPQARQTQLSDACHSSSHESNGWPCQTTGCRYHQSVSTCHDQPTGIGFCHSYGCQPTEGTTRNSEVLQLQEIGHLANNCPEPHKQCAWNKFSEKDILDIITKAVATTLDDQEKQKEVKADAKTDFWLGWQWKTHPTWPIVSQYWKIVQ